MSDSATAITNLIYTYAELIDGGDLDGVAGLFERGRICGVENGPPETVFAGTARVREMYEMATRIYCAGGWYTGDTLDITTATRQGVTIQFGGGPHPQDWYGTLDAIAAGRLDPLPSVGKIITLDEVPDALDLARRSDGPPRIVVHPNGDPA